MSNPLYEQYGKTPSGNADFLSRFERFKQSFSGNPQQIVQQMVNSGKISQSQLDSAVKMANQLAKMMK